MTKREFIRLVIRFCGIILLFFLIGSTTFILNDKLSTRSLRTMNIRFISYLTTTLALILLPIQSAYLQGYKIEASIKGVKDTSLILSYRYGTKFYSVDTARTDSYGNALFSDTLDLNRGMYQVVLPDKSFIDFFIDDSQNINITSVKNTLVDSLHSENSFPN